MDMRTSPSFRIHHNAGGRCQRHPDRSQGRRGVGSGFCPSSRIWMVALGIACGLNRLMDRPFSSGQIWAIRVCEVVGEPCEGTRILSREVVRHMTALHEMPTRESSETRTLESRVRGLTITVIVLAVALLGLGAWTIYDYATGSDMAVPGEIETLLDDYATAWNDYDSAAFLALVTDDYTFESLGQVTSAEEEAAGIAQLGLDDWGVEPTGDRIMAGDGPNYFVAQSNRVTSSVSDYEGISLYTIVERDGVYLISHHSFTGSME